MLINPEKVVVIRIHHSPITGKYYMVIYTCAIALGEPKNSPHFRLSWTMHCLQGFENYSDALSHARQKFAPQVAALMTFDHYYVDERKPAYEGNWDGVTRRTNEYAYLDSSTITFEVF